MSRSSGLWGPPDEDEAVAELIDRATFDWTDIGALVGKIGRRLGRAAPFPDKVAAMGELVGVLIDHDILPGDLGTDPDFQPWPGTRQERIDRIVQETLELDEMPRPSQIAWFHYAPPIDNPPPQ
jgi:hypothetical protein